MSLETSNQTEDGVSSEFKLNNDEMLKIEKANPIEATTTYNIDKDYEAFMNSDNELFTGKNEDNVVNFDVNEHELHSFVLAQGDEWIIDLRSDQNLHITIKAGICEIFGIELASELEYTFNSQEKMVLFAVEASEIEYRTNKSFTKGFPDCIVQNDPNILMIYSIALKLVQKRLGNLKGPRVLVIGDSNSGKTSLAKTLLAYAVKMITSSNAPIFVNLDPTKGIFTLPGPISATIINDDIQVDSPIWGESTTSSAHPLVPVFEPIVKHFGFEEINKFNYDFYMRQVDGLAKEVSTIVNESFHSNRSGIIVDTPYFSLKETVIIPNIEPSAVVDSDEIVMEEAAIKNLVENETVDNNLLLKTKEDKGLIVNKARDIKSSDYESEYDDDDDAIKVPELKVSFDNDGNLDSMEIEEDHEEDSYNLPIINSTRELIDLPYDVEFISKLVDKFDIDHIIDVVNADGSEDVTSFLNNRIFSLSSRVKKAFILPVVKSLSLETENVTESFKRFFQRSAIRAYFYGGTNKFPLSPYTTTVRYEDIYIYKHDENDCNKVVKINHITKDLLQYSVLAVTNSDIKSKDSDAIINSGIMGYVIVLSVLDASNKQMLKILSPVMGDLPKRVMLWTEFKYYE
ncbi:hypothetical protein QEN19_001523 [Hanseniaspora menglaensis]